MKKVENLTLDERLRIVSLARTNLKNYDLEIFSNNLKKAIDYSIKNPRKSLISSFLLRLVSNICS